MQCLVVDDRKFSYKLSGYIDSFLKGIFKNYQVLEINEKFDDFSQYQNIDLLFIDIDLKDLNGINIIKRLQMNNVDYPIIYVSSRQELVFSSLSTQPFYFVRKQNLENDLKELFKLLNIYYKKYRRNDFGFTIKKHKYTTKVINITFKYSVKEWNQMNKNTFVKFGYNYHDLIFQDCIAKNQAGEIV